MKFKCKLFVTTAKESGQYNICSTVAYKNTEDPVKQTEAWSTEEEAKIDAMLTPELATILIKLVGDVSFLTELRDNASNND